MWFYASIFSTSINLCSEGKIMTNFLIDKIKILLSENEINYGELSYSALHSNPQNRGRITLIIYENSRKIPSYVAKVSRSLVSRQALEREQKCLQRCIATNNFLKHQINRFNWNDEDISFILEPYLIGQQIGRFRNFEKVSQKILHWLIQLQKASSGPIWNKKDFLIFGQSLIEQVSHYYEIPPPLNRLLIELEQRMVNVGDFEIKATVVHGDLMKENLLINMNEVKVFDWEWVQEHGWPLFDAWFYLFSVSNGLKPSSNFMESGAIIIKTLLNSTKFSKHIKNLINYYNTPIDVVKCFILLTLLDIIKRDHYVLEVISGRSKLFFNILCSLGEQSEKFWEFVHSI